MTPGVNSQGDYLTPTDTLDRASGLVHLRRGNVANNGAGNSLSGEVLVNAGTVYSNGGTATQGKVKIGDSTTEVEIGSTTASHTTKIKSDLTEVGKSTHTTGDFLKWDGSKAVWAPTSSDVIELTNNPTAPGNTTDKLYNLSGELHFDGDAVPRTKTVTLTPSEYQNLGTTPITLVPAQGTGKHVVVSNVFIKAVSSSTGESRTEDLRVGHVSFSLTHYCGMYKDFLRSMPTSTTWVRQIENNSGNLSDADTGNAAILMYSTGNFTGDVILDVVITYSVIKL